MMANAAQLSRVMAGCEKCLRENNDFKVMTVGKIVWRSGELKRMFCIYVSHTTN